MGIQQAYQQLLLQLYELYDNREAANIADLTIEYVTGFRKIDRILRKEFQLNIEQQNLLQQLTQQLLLHTPVQYVLHEAWFAGMKLYVDENVLIPRPETEELVDWIRNEIKNREVKSKKLLDIGTGSGCIPIALKRLLPGLDVHAIDVSTEALSVAQKNANEQGCPVRFHCVDILDNRATTALPFFDVIVSNPPYIRESEQQAMHQNVLQHEPPLALFVPDEEPLLFYRAIADFGLQHLHNNGLLFFEINEALGKEVIELLQQKGYENVELRKDLQGKDRMVKASFFLN